MSDWEDDEYYYLSFAVEKSRRYHTKMQAFYDGWYDWTRAATALTGTASFFVLLVKGTELAKYLTAVVASAASLDSVFHFNRKARRHELLAKRFTDLSAKIAGWEALPTNLKKGKVERLKIERDEPPEKRLVDLQAYNEELRARGKPESALILLTPAQRIFGYSLTFGMRKIEAWKAAQEAIPVPLPSAPDAGPQIENSQTIPEKPDDDTE